jgi:hypothetical protein
MKNPRRFYTYAYLRKDKTPYYVGKGQGDRAYRSNGKPCAVPKDKKYIIFLKTLLFEEDAYKHEKYMIAIFGRKDLGTGILYNKSDGGEGCKGVIWTPERRELQSIKNKNRNIKPPNQKGKKSWTNGIIQTISFECPGDGWYLGSLPKPKISEINKERFSGRKWWNNGIEMKMVFECPGEGWNLGRIKTDNMIKFNNERNKGRKKSIKEIESYRKSMIGRRWWNNGVENKLVIECPGDGWVLGRCSVVKVS